MGLITLFLAFLLPKYAKMEGKIRYAQKLLTQSTLLITIHFCVQYALHKNINDVAEIRTLVNLFFGIPICYFFNISYLYLLRDGKIYKREWWVGPIALTLSTFVFIASTYTTDLYNQFTNATYLMSFIYGCTLLYYSYLPLQAFYQVKREISQTKDHPLAPLLDWTKWSLFVLIATVMGFPFMTFCTSTLMRSLYGIFSISSCFFYILSFVGYSLTNNTRQEKNISKEVVNTQETTPIFLQPEQMEQMSTIVRSFIARNLYATSGITLKDAALEMGISCNKLRNWLRSTEYEKFNNWILHLRIDKSKELLIKHPELSNEEIAEKCGFCDRQYFQLQFAKIEGVTPAKWLKERQEENARV